MQYRRTGLASRVAASALVVACALAGQPGTAAKDPGPPRGARTAADRSAAGGAWPGFRGAHRDGVSPETGLLDVWPEGGPRVAWRIAAGVGFSGVAVDGGRAFTLWQKEGEQRLVALDAADGAVLWERTLGAAFANEYGDGPRATPVIDEGRVFAIDAHGRLAAVEAADGREIWSHDLAAELGARIPPIGYASTPLVEGDSLLVEVGAEDGAFVAFDKATGEVIWSSQSDEPAYVSPVAVTLRDRRQVVFFSGSGLYALAPGDGRLLWHEPWPAPCPATGIPLNAASPVLVPPDRLFVSVAWGDRKGGAVLRIVERQEELAVETLWQAPVINSEINTAVLVGGHLYGFKGNILLSVDAETGEIGWSARGYGRGSLIAADGKLIVLGEDGRLALLEANPGEHRELATARLLSGRSWTAPALAGGRLFVRNGEEIVSVEMSARLEPAD